MALYIKSPKGEIGFTKLCEFIKKRLFFLNFLKGKSREEITTGIQQETLTANSECLIEGSAKDEISHFVLRFLCAEHAELTTFFIESETELFAYRLLFYDYFAIKQLLKKASKQSINLINKQFIIKSYKSILTTLVVIAGEFDPSLEIDHNLKVPFESALDFLKKRLYPLHAGYLEVPYQRIYTLLTLVFKELLVQAINQMKSSYCMLELKDSRLCYMKKEIKRWFNLNVAVPQVVLPYNFILEKNLDSESLKFPLCMANLHNLLRKNHRLKHNSRVQYILFLKEIGVEYSEVINLFMKEYSIPVINEFKNKASDCKHSWSDSKKRYIYSIQHLYGKQGSRKNYSAHSCRTLQSFGNSSSCEGGCPFALGGDSFKSALKSHNTEVQDIEDIEYLVVDKKFTEACQANLLKRMENYCSQTSEKSFHQNMKQGNIISSTNNCQKSKNTDRTDEKTFLKMSVLKPSSLYFKFTTQLS